MEELEKIKRWLMTCPGWTGALLVDYNTPVPGHFGLYPKGMQVLHRQEDVVGNGYCRCRSTYQLRYVTTGQADGTVSAARLLELADWVQAQSQAGLTPRLGDIPHTETFRAEKGQLRQSDQVGTAVYTIDLVAEYTKVYPAQ